MTHFAVVVFTKTGAEEEVERLLAPFNENDEWFREGSRWDWWIIGGRWDGAMLGLDHLELKETCTLCAGTGRRTDLEGAAWATPEWLEWSHGCNGCMGAGQQAVWPTDNRYSDPARNVGSTNQIASDFTPAAFVTPDGEWIEADRIGWFGAGTEASNEDGWKMKWTEAKGVFADAIAVLVDCHV